MYVTQLKSSLPTYKGTDTYPTQFQSSDYWGQEYGNREGKVWCLLSAFFTNTWMEYMN